MLRDAENGQIRAHDCPFYEMGTSDIHSLIKELERTNDMLERLLEQWTTAIPVRSHLISLASTAGACIGATAIIKFLHLL